MKHTDTLEQLDASTRGGGEGLWPSVQYTEQVERLRAAVGESIYLVEIAATEVQLRTEVSPFSKSPAAPLLGDGQFRQVWRLCRQTYRKMLLPLRQSPLKR